MPNLITDSGLSFRALLKLSLPESDVCLGSLADIASRPRHVRSSPKADIRQCAHPHCYKRTSKVAGPSPVAPDLGPH